ncbi:MAG: S1 RNA-binding domain-containing protein, partial [Chloroflexota bacterium]|nr:S1 RNA-binding domain-containing protein [Chloroflexota bacterium]
MTAGVKFGSEKAKHRIDLQDEAVNSIFIPDELDEDWWAAVLADEPQIVNEIKPIQTILYEERESFTWPHPSPTIDWERVRTIFTNDEIVKMNVVSHNHGGILVASEDCHGFVPVSHLIDIPLELVDDDREQYLTHYLGRKVSLKVIECDPAKERIVFSERAALAK